MKRYFPNIHSLAGLYFIHGRFKMNYWKIITRGAGDLARSTSGSGCGNLCHVPDVSET